PQGGSLNEKDLERSATRKTPNPYTPRAESQSGPGTLGSIPPFGEQNWQAPPYQPGMAVNAGPEAKEQTKTDRDRFEKASLVFVHSASVIRPGAAHLQRRDNAAADYP